MPGSKLSTELPHDKPLPLYATCGPRRRFTERIFRRASIDQGVAALETAGGPMLAMLMVALQVELGVAVRMAILEILALNNVAAPARKAAL